MPVAVAVPASQSSTDLSLTTEFLRKFITVRCQAPLGSGAPVLGLLTAGEGGFSPLFFIPAIRTTPKNSSMNPHLMRTRPTRWSIGNGQSAGVHGMLSPSPR